MERVSRDADKRRSVLTCAVARLLSTWKQSEQSSETVFELGKKKRGCQKRVYPPKTLTKRGTLLFVDREVFYVHVVVGINSMAQQDVCASTVHYSSYIHHHCIRTAKRPTAGGTSTLLSGKPNVYVRVTSLICAPRACVSSKKSLIS